MGWARIDTVVPADGPFASFKVGGVDNDLKLNSDKAVTKNDIVWIPGVGDMAKQWVHIAVVLDPVAGSYIRVATSNGPAEVSIPPLTLDSSTDIAKLGGLTTTHVQVSPT